jgi:NAD(P)-dependent dehydrogenase (short-subunit alcohol dehydrogenase family)
MGHTLGALGSIFFTFLPDQFFNKLELPVESDLMGRTYLITGSNTGLGLAAAIHLAHLNAAHLVLGVHDLIRGTKARDEIIAQTKFSGIIDVWELDMAKFDSVKSFAERAKNTLAGLDGALVNAGIGNPDRWEVTMDGWERTCVFINIGIIGN